MRTMLTCPLSGGEPATRPDPPASRPVEDPLAPGVEDAERQDGDEDAHLRDGQTAETGTIEDQRPWEEKYGFNGEKYIEVRVDVVPDLGLRPVAADRVDAALVRDPLSRGLRRTGRSEQPVRPERGHEQQHPGD